MAFEKIKGIDEVIELLLHTHPTLRGIFITQSPPSTKLVL
jgi:hypothetical protein